MSQLNKQRADKYKKEQTHISASTLSALSDDLYKLKNIIDDDELSDIAKKINTYIDKARNAQNDYTLRTHVKKAIEQYENLQKRGRAQLRVPPRILEQYYTQTLQSLQTFQNSTIPSHKHIAHTQYAIQNFIELCNDICRDYDIHDNALRDMIRTTPYTRIGRNHTIIKHNVENIYNALHNKMHTTHTFGLSTAQRRWQYVTHFFQGASRSKTPTPNHNRDTIETTISNLRLYLNTREAYNLDRPIRFIDWLLRPIQTWNTWAKKCHLPDTTIIPHVTEDISHVNTLNTVLGYLESWHIPAGTWLNRCIGGVYRGYMGYRNTQHAIQAPEERRKAMQQAIGEYYYQKAHDDVVDQLQTCLYVHKNLLPSCVNENIQRKKFDMCTLQAIHASHTWNAYRKDKARTAIQAFIDNKRKALHHTNNELNESHNPQHFGGKDRNRSSTQLNNEIQYLRDQLTHTMQQFDERERALSDINKNIGLIRPYNVYPNNQAVCN